MKEEMKKWKGTCSIDNPKEGHVTFARNSEYLNKLEGCNLTLGVFVPEEAQGWLWPLGVTIQIYHREFPEFEFAKFHNEFYRGTEPDENLYADIDYPWKGIDKSIVISEGIHVSIGPNNERIQLKHMGNVIFEEGCRVGPLTFIQRATLPGCSTIIKKGALVDGQCTIGHNAVIGENSLVAAGSVIGAGSVVGKNCLLGIHTVTKPHVKICDRVVTGIGSVVVKDIDKPGIYMGSPAKFYKEHPDGWMW